MQRRKRKQKAFVVVLCLATALLPRCKYSIAWITTHLYYSIDIAQADYVRMRLWKKNEKPRVNEKATRRPEQICGLLNSYWKWNGKVLSVWLCGCVRVCMHACHIREGISETVLI